VEDLQGKMVAKGLAKARIVDVRFLADDTVAVLDETGRLEFFDLVGTTSRRRGVEGADGRDFLGRVERVLAVQTSVPKVRPGVVLLQQHGGALTRYAWESLQIRGEDHAADTAVVCATMTAAHVVAFRTDGSMHVYDQDMRPVGLGKALGLDVVEAHPGPGATVTALTREGALWRVGPRTGRAVPFKMLDKDTIRTLAVCPVDGLTLAVLYRGDKDTAIYHYRLTNAKRYHDPEPVL
jgi:hypothetical protein